jgi:proteasome lid subunit RPN8/RPN11
VVTAGGLRLPRPIADELLRHAVAELPNEACGILAGSLATATARVFHPARNEEASPLRYSIHTDDLYRISVALDDAHEDIVAIFHSHTQSPAVPSPTDIRAAEYPAAFYLLATLADREAPPERSLRAWRILGGEATEVPLELV